VRHTGVFSISFHRFDNNSIEDQAPRKNKKKESKGLLSGKCAAISSRKRFFAKTISVKNDTAILFAKKYCIAFSFHTVRALSFFLFFLLKNFQRSKIF
jgi:ribosomal protein L33